MRGDILILETKFDIDKRVICLIGVATGFGLDAVYDVRLSLAILGGLGFCFSLLVFVINPVRNRLESQNLDVLPFRIFRPTLPKVPQPTILDRIRLNRFRTDQESASSREPSRIKPD